MLRSFVSWLDDYLAGQAPSVVVKAVIGIMSFAVLVGTVFGDITVKAGALVAAVFMVLALGLLLLADRRAIQLELKEKGALLAHYCKVLDTQKPNYELITWEQVAIIGQDGDTEESITLRAKVLSDELWVLRLAFGCGWPQHVKYRRKVKFTVRNLLTGDAYGASLRNTILWAEDGLAYVIVHFPRPPRRGAEISFMVEWIWPGKCVPLMRLGVPDDFTFRFVTAAAYARYKLILPRSIEAYVEPIGFEEGDGDYVMGSVRDDEGRSQYLFEAVNLPIRHRAGVRLELKGGGARQK